MNLEPENSKTGNQGLGTRKLGTRRSGTRELDSGGGGRFGCLQYEKLELVM
jgi:hypothetical protein